MVTGRLERWHCGPEFSWKEIEEWPLQPEQKWGDLLKTDEGVKMEKATVAAAVVQADF